MAGNTPAGELKLCSEFFVTYYWTLPAVGQHLFTNITLATISVISAVLGTIANFLVVLSYFKNSRLRTVSNVPLVSLAFSDLLVTAVVLPLHTARLLKEIYGTHNCVLWTFFRLSSYFSVGVSLLTVTFISVERFITLAYPYRYQTMLTRIRMKIVVVIIWCFMLAYVVSHLWLIPNKVFLAISATAVIVCIIILLSIWIWVLKLLRNHKRRITSDHTPAQISTNESKRPQQTYKNTRTCCAIVTGLVVCYFPVVCTFVYYLSEPRSYTGIYLVTPWVQTIAYVHSLLNPLLVLWRKSEFKQTSRHFIGQLKCCRCA